jgi:hypothetical protein
MNKEELFIYLLKSVILSGIFFGYYVLCLRNTIYHVYNRFYLLGTMALSVLDSFFKVLYIFVFRGTSGWGQPGNALLNPVAKRRGERRRNRVGNRRV